MLCALIGMINTNFGISIGLGIKINVSDILFMIYFSYQFILKKKNLIKFEPIKYIFIIVVAMTISIPWGVTNGGEIGLTIRVLRNYIYIIFMFWLTYSNYKSKASINIYKDLILLSWIAIINCLINVTLDYLENSWFMYYRENSSFQVFMFTFLLFYKNNQNEYINRKILRIITVLFLGICIFLSQERLQIIAIITSIFVYGIYRLFILFREQRIKVKKISIKNFFLNFIIMLVFVTIFIKILNMEYIQNYIEYFIEYRIGSVIKNNEFKLDGSLSARQLQLINILNRNWIYSIVGSGCGSLYISATGPIHMVDSMWLWIFKDLGIIGIVLLILVYLSIIIEIKKIKNNRLAIQLGLIAVIVLQLFTPNIMLGISDSIFTGYLLSLICLGKFNKFCI